MPECQFIEECQRERVQNSEFKGIVTTKLDTIEKSVNDIWAAVNTGREHTLRIYLTLGVISGTTSLIVSLIASLFFLRGGFG